MIVKRSCPSLRFGGWSAERFFGVLRGSVKGFEAGVRQAFARSLVAIGDSQFLWISEGGRADH